MKGMRIGLCGFPEEAGYVEPGMRKKMPRWAPILLSGGLLSGCMFDGGDHALTGTWTHEHYFSLSYTWMYTDSVTFSENGRMEFDRVDGLGLELAFWGDWTLGKEGLSIVKDSCARRSDAGTMEPVDCEQFESLRKALGYDGKTLYRTDSESGARIPFDKR